MKQLAISAFQVLSSSDSAEQASDFLFANPVLLCESLFPLFAAWAREQPEDMQRGAARALQFVEGVLRQIVSDGHAFPLGLGPLEPIIARLLRGEISPDAARDLASKDHVYQNLSPAYIRELSGQNQAAANHGKAEQALQAQQVLLAALDARRPSGAPEQELMEALAAIDYAVIAARAVWRTADGRLFHDAVRRARAAEQTDLSAWHTPGELQYSLGVLHLDPYIYTRTSTGFPQQVELWRRKPEDDAGYEFSEEERRELLAPEPREALSAAAAYFRQSAEHRKGAARGRSLKGYAEAEVWKQLAGGEASPEAVTAAREARDLLQGGELAGIRAEAETLLRYLERSRPAGNAGEWLTTGRALMGRETSELLAEHGEQGAGDLLAHVAGAAVDASPHLSLMLWLKALPLFLERDETSRRGFYAAGLRYLRDSSGAERLRPGGPSPLAVAEQMANSGLPVQQLAASLVSVAADSQLQDAEAEGIAVLQKAAEADSAFTSGFLPLIFWLAGMLYMGKASNEVSAGEPEAAVRSCAAAMNRFLRTQMPGMAGEMLTRAAHLAMTHPEEALTTFLVTIGAVLPELERQGGPDAVRQVNRIYRQLMPLLARGGKVNTVLLMLMLTALKGSGLAAALRAEPSPGWLDSEEAHRLLERISEVRSQALAAGGEARGHGVLDEEDLLTMYSEQEESSSHDSPAAVLHNLEVRFDAALRRAASAMPAASDWQMLPDQIRQTLGPETVLVTLCSGVTPGGSSGLYINFITEEEIAGAIAEGSLPGMQLQVGGLAADVFALSVTALRRSINAEPEDGIASREGRSQLEALGEYFGGPAAEILRRLRDSGKRHLCIHPHGPLHFLPFHLLPFDGGLMADQWTVTYLPNLALLDPVREQKPDRELPVASFGIGFRGNQPHGLPELPGAEEEASVAAQAFGREAQTGSDATETALLEALNKAKRIHVATHGLHAVSAPSFQRVYLSPDANYDGILYAYELLRLDLRGLDLLTLSACETALGRVDVGDNLRGLPANALIAGAATVIGALWPVENETARTFFGSLYQALAAGADKREAFRTAQSAAREKHPQFRDWGAFTYCGNW